MGNYKKIYCIECEKHTDPISKLSAVREGLRVCSECRRMNGVYTLVKPDDKTFFKGSSEVKWVKYNEVGVYKNTLDDIEVGTSLLMGPFSDSFTWLTTIVKEIINNNELFVEFETENSLYILYKPIK